MKTIGLLGGMSWESTVSYYKAINQGVKSQLGGLHSAKILLNSVDFQPIETLQHQNKWQETADILTVAAQSIQAGGADCLLICTNTMHKVAGNIQAQIDIPIIHIADATGQVLMINNITKIGLLGTRFTMEQNFYKQRLIDKFGIDVMIPTTTQIDDIHRIIYQELCLGKIEFSSKQRYLEIIDDMYQKGAQGVILGCTEIALLINQQDTDVPLFDTTKIHADAAVKFALN
ncbi:aspartate/glutamate racemase family protein [Thalassotalea atypica]|uniref:aspartate/glutamate racemase family protein n=1 Tax=Thalassotalea atypica TaxID=2054316 RepID=UPI0025747F2C|nr:aspartate/glutamate racemase family protein [Thalassotalea atypica]